MYWTLWIMLGSFLMLTNYVNALKVYTTPDTLAQKDILNKARLSTVLLQKVVVYRSELVRVYTI